MNTEQVCYSYSTNIIQILWRCRGGASGLQLVNNVGDAVQNGVFRKHSERIVPAHVVLELGLLEEVPGGDARSPYHRDSDVAS